MSVARPACKSFLAIWLVVWLLVAASAGPAAAAPSLGDNQWTKRDLDGVPVSALAVDPTDQSVLYAGSGDGRFGGGLFRSTDAGQSWSSVVSGLGNLFVNALSIDPASSTIVLAGTGRGPAVGESSAGIYRTTNRGDSWTAVLAGQSIHALARSPQNPQVVYAAGSGVFRSSDGGATWARLAQGDAALANVDLRGIAVSPADPSLLVAVGNTEGGSGRVLRSTNGGANWALALGGSLGPVYAATFAPASGGGQYLLVATQTGAFRSTNGGVTYERVTEELGNVGVLAVLVNPSNPTHAFIGTVSRGVFESADAGVSWRPLDPSLGNQTIRALAADRRSPQSLYAGSEGGVFAFTFAPPPTPTASTWYFAEGSTQPPFDTWLLVQNPTTQTASVRFTFQVQGGGEAVRTALVGPSSRFSLFVNEVLPNTAFSTRVDADQQVFAERAMYVGYDGHVVTGIPGPNSTWLFAEGSTQSPFHTWLLLQNPHSGHARATVTYHLQDGSPVTQILSLPPTSRTSIFVNEVLPNRAFSAVVNADAPIVAERAMYRFPGNAATGVSGVNAPSRTWYFAHGDTSAGAHTWLLLQNPAESVITANVALLDERGNRTSLPITLPPMSRRSLFLNQVLGFHRFGIVVEASEPIVAEKSLFFGAEPRGAAATQGAAALATTWNLPEGSTAPPFDELISILNPHAQVMNVHVDFQLPNGQVIGRDFAIGPTRNLVIRVDDIILNSAVSARVTTSLPSAVERTMLFGKAGSLGGHNTIGIAR